MNRYASAAAVLLLAYGFAVPAADQTSNPSRVVWLDDLESAGRTARAAKNKILVRVGAEWCGWCEKLADELDRADVQKELRNFTLVYIDADKDTASVRRLGIGPIPALRVLNDDRKVLAAHDGYLTAAELIDWLSGAADGEAIQAPEVLTSTGPLDDKGVNQLLRELGRREAQRREAAIRRLQEQVGAAGDVVDLLQSKKLAVRLSALQLLRAWRAPIDGLDPWRPETMNEARLAALAEWAENAPELPPEEPLSPDELAEARGEIDKFLLADQIEAEAVAARLARYGRALLEEVYSRLQQAGDERQRERLTWLRYRLVATDALALGWPGGLARLASNDTATRHQAAQELIGRATSDDEPLLLEMFSDPDPLVRELSLKALHSTGGERVSKALVRLLDDPEPNVRAAVLKQLTESPSASMVPSVSKYISGETDADLVVHAVRLLRATGGKAAVDALMNLLDHESWRVRAEAAEALGECASSHQRQLAESIKADVYVALIDALDDEDGFVVSRSMLGLRHADVPAMIDPLAAAAEKRPELAKAAAEAMTSGQHARGKAIDRLWDWTRHANEDLRAAGLIGLCQANVADLGEAFDKALADSSAKVRIAAAEQVFRMLENQRPYSEEMLDPLAETEFQLGAVGNVMMTGDDDHDANLAAGVWSGLKRVILGKKATEKKQAEAPDQVIKEAEVESPDDAMDDAEFTKRKTKADRDRPDPWEPWLAEFRNGEGRPRWTKSLAPGLQKMLAADEPHERIAAALALVPLGREADSLPVLRDLVAADRKRIAQAAGVLAWLPWQERLAWFEELRTLAADPDVKIELAHRFALLRDLRAGEPLWQTLVDDDLHSSVAQAIFDDLKHTYRIGQTYYGNGTPPPPQLDEALARRYAVKGTAWQRLLALALLLATDETAAAEIAQQISDDAQQSPEAHDDALQFSLLAQKAEAARNTALGVLRGGEPGAQRIALAYLARGPEPLRNFRGGAFHIEPDDNRMQMFGVGEAERPVAPEVPAGLEAGDVRPFLTDADRALAAFAGYLLTQLGEADGLEPLLQQWRAEGAASNLWTPLVYHALAALDDSRHADLLVEIYDRSEHNGVDMRDFYWTIRSMTGPEVLQLRKRIRDEIGMDQLRQ
ncbi:MAG TPA: HEAT repeat domain-containing protein [Pirellulales bacterium]|nr:HEAT repeat domain-containing protein [Pirellulales bacterium]